MGIRREALSGIKWTSISSSVTSLLQLIQLIALTNYLSPDEFGLMALMMVVIGFSRAFMDMGISNALIHHQIISMDNLSSLYWLNIIAGVLVFLILTLISPVFASFYSEPRIQELLVILSVSFIITSFGNQYRVLFQKNLKFEVLAIVEIVSTIISFVSAIIIAEYGGGIYALIFSVLIYSFISSFLFLLIGLKRFKRPIFHFKYSDIKPYLNFGLFQMAEKSINYFNTQFDVLLIGKVLGPEATGIYHIAKTLTFKIIGVVNPVVTKVTFPILAKNQDNNLVMKDIYLKSVKIVSLLIYPIFLIVFLLSEPIIVTFFGGEWIASGLILQFLAIYCMFRASGNPIGSLLLARGRADLGFYWNLALFVIIPISLFIGSTWGLIGIALSQIILMISLIIPGWYILVKPLCKATFLEYFFSFGKPMFYTLITGLIVFPFSLISNTYLAITLTVFAVLCVYGLIMYLFENRLFNYFNSY